MTDNKKKTQELLDQGLKLLNNKEPEKALPPFNQSIELDPDNLFAYQMRLSVFYNLGRYKNVIDDINQVIRLDPGNKKYFLQRGVSKSWLKLYWEAIDDYDLAINHEPFNAIIYVCRGIAKNEIELYDEAIADFDEAIKLDPNLIESYYNRGNSNVTKGEIKRGIEDLKLFVKLAEKGDEYIGDIERVKNDIESIYDILLGHEGGSKKIIEPLQTPKPKLDLKQIDCEAVMFIDMTGSTIVMREYGVNWYLELYNKLEETFHGVSVPNNRLFIKGLGDGFMATFKKREEAVDSSRELISTLAKYNENAEEGRRIDIRVGIDFGEIRISSDGDRLGIPVNTASRIEGVKKEDFGSLLKIDDGKFPETNRIFVTYIAAKPIMDKFTCHEVGDAKLKGMDGIGYNIFHIEH